MIGRSAVVVSVAALAACLGPPPRTADLVPPSVLLGAFLDDYGSNYRISDTLFEQLPRSRYRIVEWHPVEQYFVAQNDSGNPGDHGLWSRVDWMPLAEMSPWSWGFCLTTWDAPTAAAARATQPADRAAPRTGCGGHPFTRMQRQP